MIKGEKILVTGANTGFIGRHLADKLEVDNHVIRLSRQDFNNVTLLSSGYLNQFDYIFNLAAYGSQRQETSLSVILDTNLIVPIHLMTGEKAKAIIFCGSSSEFGPRPGTKGMCETDMSYPYTFYAGTKVAVTALVKSLGQQEGSPMATARPFSVYGPREKEHRFVPTVIRSCIRGEPMKLCPEQTHDWIYVDDFVDGMIVLAQALILPQLRGGDFNFGTGIPTTNREVVTIIEELTGKKALIDGELPRKKEDPEQWFACTHKTKELLKWEAKTNIVRGLQKTIDYYKPIYEQS